MFHQICFSPLVKETVFVRNEDGIYELPHEFLNDLSLMISGNQKMSERPQNLAE